jgi:hypothetical protein
MDWYIREWNIPAKVANAKLAGTWEKIVSDGAV